MARLSKSPSYLSRNPYSYCFRMAVPPDLLPYVGKQELRYSLKTGYLSEAKILARLMAGKVQALFRAIRQGDPRLKGITPELVTELIRKNHQEVMDKAKQLVNPFNNAPDSYDYYVTKEIKTVADLQTHLDALEHFREQYTFSLVTGKYDEVKDKAENLLGTAGVEYQEESELFLTLCRGLLKTEIDGVNAEIAALSYGGSQGQTEKVTPQADPGKPVSEIKDLWVKDNKEWADTSHKANVGSLNQLLDIVGDVPINKIDREAIGEMKHKMLYLPSNRKKKKAYRNYSIDELVEMDISEDDLMRPKTINNHLSRIGTFFKWAINNGKYKAGPNPATDMEITIKKKKNQARAPYTKEELVKLFRSKDYLDDAHRRSWQFWTPVLALFTGARQQEIAQLYLDDIKQADGVWVIDLKGEKDKSLKTPISERLIPIHPFILDGLNFLKRVERLRSEGHERLFPEIKTSKYGYGRPVSRWFCGTYRDKCGIVSDDGRMRDFHSFRTTFINDLQHKKVDLPRLNQVCGHSRGKDEGSTTYTEDFPPNQILKEIILKVDYHERIDLSHLKNSRYVIKD